ncbi:hypothetical protein CN918_28100 [Priestia megaterium]|nr:hypothetical protein CN918_28100 [Priestia megaterium]
MNSIEILLLNIKEVRRRSELIWRAIPTNALSWRPDDDALSCFEMIRHVLDSEHYYHLALKNKGSLIAYESPFEKREYVSVEEELNFARPYREAYISTIKDYSEEDLHAIKIDRSDVGYIRPLGDMIQRITYHESVHAGQLLDYLRTAGIKRPNIWD